MVAAISAPTTGGDSPPEWESLTVNADDRPAAGGQDQRRPPPDPGAV
jgi:hypothetical protein